MHSTVKNLSDIHKVVYQKPYDIIPTDWIEAIFRKDDHPQKIDRFWCAALVGYIYTKCGILEKNTDWSVLRPSDFSIQSKNILKFNIDCNLENQETKIL